MIDKVARVIFSKSIRDRLGQGGSETEVELGPEVRVEERGDGPVLVTEPPGSALSTNEVRELVDEDRAQ